MILPRPHCHFPAAAVNMRIVTKSGAFCKLQTPIDARDPPSSVAAMEWRAPLVILIAEDDENDSFLLQRAFKKVGLTMPSHICRDGAEAISYLRGEGAFADRAKYPFPRVLITDLKMPKSSGFDLLRWLHDHPECNLIPKIVLSASAEAKDVTLAYQLGANSYFKKPATFDRLVECVRLWQTFWERAELPEMPKTC